MKTHPLSHAYLLLIGAEPPDEDERCIYEAEVGECWRGFFVGRVGWNGGGSIPGSVAASCVMALELWKDQVKAYSARQ